MITASASPFSSASATDPSTVSDAPSSTFAGSISQPVASLIKLEATSVAQLRRFADSNYLFALVDSTDETSVPHKATSLGLTKAVSLFSGTAREHYWSVAPYLFRVDAELLKWILVELSEKPWGIFAITKASFEEVRLHLKKFLIVRFPDGKRWYFRYYDPRILKTYLPVCNPWELTKFFGPIRGFALLGAGDEAPLLLQNQAPSVDTSATPEQTEMFWPIRAEHDQAFQRLAEKQFVNRSLEFLQARLPAETGALPPELLRKRVEGGISRARKYGMTWESSLLTYVTLLFEVGFNFDAHPLIRQVLIDERIPANNRIKRVLNTLSEEEWQEIRDWVRLSPGAKV